MKELGHIQQLVPFGIVQLTQHTWMRWMENDVNITVLPIAGDPLVWAPPADLICATEPLYLGHGFMRMTYQLGPTGAIDHHHFSIRGDVENDASETAKVKYSYDLKCDRDGDCDLKQADLVIW